MKSAGDRQQGDVAQMVERVLSMHEAQGSIPCFSNFCQSLSSHLARPSASAGASVVLPMPVCLPSSPHTHLSFSSIFLVFPSTSSTAFHLNVRNEEVTKPIYIFRVVVRWYSVVVSIDGCDPSDPGSIPGTAIFVSY